MFTLNLKDVAKGLVMAVLGGLFLPIEAAVQTPGFSIATVDWHGVLILAINGAILGAVTYLVKNFFTSSPAEGEKFAGVIG